MPAHKLVSEPQERLLLNFMRANPALIVGRVSAHGGPLAKSQVQEAWASLATRLNALGGKKTPIKWRDYWAERKYAVRKKAALRSIAAGTGAPAPKASKLTEVEEEILELIGKAPVSRDGPIKLPFHESSRPSTTQSPLGNLLHQLSSASSPDPESHHTSLLQHTPHLSQIKSESTLSIQHIPEVSLEHRPGVLEQHQSDIESQRLATQAAMTSAIERLATAAEANTSAVERLAAAAEINTELLRLLLQEFMGRQE